MLRPVDYSKTIPFFGVRKGFEVIRVCVCSVGVGDIHAADKEEGWKGRQGEEAVKLGRSCPRQGQGIPCVAR